MSSATSACCCATLPLDNGEFVVDMTRFDRVVPDAVPRDSVPA